MSRPLFRGVAAPDSRSCSNVGLHHQIARKPGKPLSTSAWNRKVTGPYDGVTPTLVYMAFALAICGDPEDPRDGISTHTRG